eukprot:SM000035S13111  [mRNA]  locus=s35:529528:540348:+ [translate_table: standard]
MTAKVEALAVLRAVAQGLAAKLYRLRRIMDGGGGGGGEQQPRVPPLAVQCGLLPDAPRLLHHLARAFPDHPRDCNPEKVDREALDHLQEAAQEYYDLLEPWYLVLWEAMRLREQAVRLLSALSSGITSASFDANPLFMRACMGLLCDFARTVVLVAKVGAPMLLQVYALLSVYVTGGNDPADYIKVVSFAQVCSVPFRTLQLDLESSGALISEALRSIVPVINATAEMAAFKDGSTLLALVTDDPATTLRLQDLAHTHDYKQWMLLGCLIRPYELLRGYKASTAAALLQENFILPVFRDEVILIHDEYAQHVLPKVAEMGKAAKAARSHSKDMEARYRQAKRSHRRIGEVYDLGLKTMAAVHYRQRNLLHHELSNLLLYFSDNLPLLPTYFQIILAALSMAHEEILWYFEHAGVITARDHKTSGLSMLKKSSTVLTQPSGNAICMHHSQHELRPWGSSLIAALAAQEIPDPSVGFLLDVVHQLHSLALEHASTIASQSQKQLVEIGPRLRHKLQSEQLLAANVDPSLIRSLERMCQTLEDVPTSCQAYRKDWLQVSFSLAAANSPMSARQLEDATKGADQEAGIITNLHICYTLCRNVDEVKEQLTELVFRQTMLGPEAQPQHGCAWLNLAKYFPWNCSFEFPEEEEDIVKVAVNYTEEVLESLMAEVERLIAVLQASLGSLDKKLLPVQGAVRLNHAATVGQLARRANPGKLVSLPLSLPLPGSESQYANRAEIQQMERATVGLLALASKLDTMGPQVVAGEVFVPREYLRQRLMGSFHKALEAAAVIDGAVQKPSMVEAALNRHAAILSMIEESTSLQFRDAWTMDDSAAALRDRMAEWLTDQALQLAQPLRKDLVISSEASLAAELEAFVRVFGHAGLEALGLRAGALLDALLARLNTVLGRNHAALGLLAQRADCRLDLNLKTSCESLASLELGLALLIGLGRWLVWRDLVAVSASRTLSGCAPALHLLVQWVNRHLPAGSHPANLYQDAVGELGDAVQKLACGGAHRSWHLLPYLCGSVFALDLWADACMDGHAPALTRAMAAVLDVAASGALPTPPSTSATAAGGSDAPSGDQTCVRITAVLTLAHRASSRAALERRLLFLGRLGEACPGFPHGVLERHLPLALLTSVRQQHQQRVAIMTAPVAAAPTATSPRAADLEAMIDGAFQAPEVDRLGRRGTHGSGAEGGNPLAHVGVLRPTKSLGSHEHANCEGDGVGDAAGPSVLARKLLRSLSIGVAAGGGGRTRPSPAASEPGDDDAASLSPNDSLTGSTPAGSGGDKGKQRARRPLASPLSFGRR